MSLVHLGVGGEWLQIVGTSIHFERLLVYCFSQLHPPRGRVEPTVNNFRERERERERERKRERENERERKGVKNCTHTPFW